MKINTTINIMIGRWARQWFGLGFIVVNVRSKDQARPNLVRGLNSLTEKITAHESLLIRKLWRSVVCEGVNYWETSYPATQSTAQTLAFFLPHFLFLAARFDLRWRLRTSKIHNRITQCELLYIRILTSRCFSFTSVKRQVF